MSDKTYTVYGGKRGGGQILELGKLLAFKDEQLREAQTEIERWKSAALYYAEKCGSMPKWIPVSERLPENDYGTHWKERPHYLVLLRNGLMRVATYGYKEHGWWIDSHNCVLAAKHYTEVTHWMPLPEPPKGE